MDTLDDMTIGRNLRLLRQSRGMSMRALAEMLGVTYQQVQKYEKGMSSMSSLRLHKASVALNVPCEAFFEGGQSSLRNPVINPGIMTRALKLQHIHDRAQRAKILKIIDILVS